MNESWTLQMRKLRFTGMKALDHEQHQIRLPETREYDYSKGFKTERRKLQITQPKPNSEKG